MIRDLDHMKPKLAPHWIADLVFLHLKRGRRKLRHHLFPTEKVQIPTILLGTRILRKFLRQLIKGLPLLHPRHNRRRRLLLRRDHVRLRILRHRYQNVARTHLLRLFELIRVLLVKIFHFRVRHFRQPLDLLINPLLLAQSFPNILLHLLHGQTTLLNLLLQLLVRPKTHLKFLHLRRHILIRNLHPSRPLGNDLLHNHIIQNHPIPLHPLFRRQLVPRNPLRTQHPRKGLLQIRLLNLQPLHDRHNLRQIYWHHWHHWRSFHHRWHDRGIILHRRILLHHRHFLRRSCAFLWRIRGEYRGARKNHGGENASGENEFWVWFHLEKWAKLSAL